MAIEKTGFGMIRHALTQWNREKRIQGQTDIPLCSEGRAQVRRWVPKLQGANTWERIISSDLDRCLATARIINEYLKVELVVDNRLRELHWGHWEGKTGKELEKEQDGQLVKLLSAGWEFAPPGGEKRLELWHRARKALMDAASKWPGENILVVTHQGVIKCLLYRLLGRQYVPGEPDILNIYHLHGIYSDSNGLHLGSINSLPLENG